MAVALRVTAGGVDKETKIVGVHAVKLFKGGRRAAGLKDAGERDDDNGKEHQAALEKVGTANSYIAAGKGVENNDACGNEQRLKIRQPKDRIEQGVHRRRSRRRCR